MIANASHPRSQTHRETSPAPEAEAEAEAERSLLGEPFHHVVQKGNARGWLTGMMTPVGARMKAAPEGGGTPLRGLTHSLDLGKEGLAMKATQCCYPPCTEPVAKGRSRHFCNSHEYRWRKGGEATARPKRRAPLDEALRSIGWTVTESGCWEWKGYRSNGYGRLRGEPVTRIMWRITTGEVVPDHLHMCHKCDNPPCMNPAHLFVGTRSDNMRDMVAKGRHSTLRLKGDSHPRSTLTDEQVTAIRERYTGTRGEFTALAKEYGVSGQHIAAIIKGQRR